MCNLRSRPMKELLWNYYFYVELDGEAYGFATFSGAGGLGTITSDASALPVAKIKADLGITDQSAVTNIVNDQSSGDTELNNELSDASTRISSGGKNIKNINITINDGLVHGVQNYFNGSDDNPESSSDFMWRLANALQLVVNDVNYD